MLLDATYSIILIRRAELLFVSYAKKLASSMKRNMKFDAVLAMVKKR
jgi:hypothetical protein